MHHSRPIYSAHHCRSCLLVPVQPGEADADLADMIAVVVKLVAELTATTRPGGRNPTSYGKYKAALACLQKLGPRFVAARLLTRTAPLATGPGAAAAAAGQPVVAVVLLEGLLEVSANSVNKEMRAAAEAALTATASLVRVLLFRAQHAKGIERQLPFLRDPPVAHGIRWRDRGQLCQC